MSNEGYQLITIREFKNLNATIEYIKTLQATNFKGKKLKLTEPVIEYAISTKNFKVVLKDKKIEKFEAFYKKQIAALQN
jgi:16S rRNA G527 N7-methylase RsmG